MFRLQLLPWKILSFKRWLVKTQAGISRHEEDVLDSHLLWAQTTASLQYGFRHAFQCRACEFDHRPQRTVIGTTDKEFKKLIYGQ